MCSIGFPNVTVFTALNNSLCHRQSVFYEVQTVFLKSLISNLCWKVKEHLLVWYIGLTRSNIRFKNWYNDLQKFETQLVPRQFKSLRVLILVYIFTTHYEIICMQISRHMSQSVPPCVEKVSCVVAKKIVQYMGPLIFYTLFIFNFHI